MSDIREFVKESDDIILSIEFLDKNCIPVETISRTIPANTPIFERGSSVLNIIQEAKTKYGDSVHFHEILANGQRPYIALSPEAMKILGITVH